MKRISVGWLSEKLQCCGLLDKRKGGDEEVLVAMVEGKGLVGFSEGSGGC